MKKNLFFTLVTTSDIVTIQPLEGCKTVEQAVEMIDGMANQGEIVSQPLRRRDLKDIQHVIAELLK